MLLTYVDETHDNVYFVNALVVTPDVLQDLSAEIRNLNMIISEHYECSPNIEFHGYELFHGVGQWAFLKGQYEAQKFIYLTFLSILANHNVEIYIKGIEIKGFENIYGNQRHIIHNAAMTWNLEKVQDKAESLNTYALVIADDVNSHSDYYRANLRYHQQNPTFGWRPVILDRIIDTLHFAPSEESLMIQTIDMISFAHIRSRSIVESLLLDEFQKQLWKVVTDSQRIKYEGIWNPPVRTS
jgi:hypothetical protein